MLALGLADPADRAHGPDRPSAVHDPARRAATAPPMPAGLDDPRGARPTPDMADFARALEGYPAPGTDVFAERAPRRRARAALLGRVPRRPAGRVLRRARHRRVRRRRVRRHARGRRAGHGIRRRDDLGRDARRPDTSRRCSSPATPASPSTSGWATSGSCGSPCGAARRRADAASRRRACGSRYERALLRLPQTAMTHHWPERLRELVVERPLALVVAARLEPRPRAVGDRLHHDRDAAGRARRRRPRRDRSRRSSPVGVEAAPRAGSAPPPSFSTATAPCVERLAVVGEEQRAQRLAQLDDPRRWSAGLNRVAGVEQVVLGEPGLTLAVAGRRARRRRTPRRACSRTGAPARAAGRDPRRVLGGRDRALGVGVAVATCPGYPDRHQ